MKYLSLLFLFINAYITQAQYTYEYLSYNVRDIVYSKIQDKFYSLNSNGQEVYEISFDGEPPTLLVDGLLGSVQLFLSADENYFYTSTDFSNATTKYSFITNEKLTINTGFDPIMGPFRPEYIAVFPNNPNSIVVSKRVPGSHPYHYGLAIYDGTIMRPQTTSPGYGSNMTKFVNEDTLIGLTLEANRGDFRFLKIDNDGISEYYVFENAVNEAWDFITNGNYIYTNNGHVLEFNTETPSLQYISRLHNNFWASVMYDSYNDYIIYLFRNNNNEVNISRFKASNQEFVDESIMDLGDFNAPLKIISCGSDCYAARMYSGSSYRIYKFKKTDIMEINENNKKAIKLYPNPSSGDFYIESDKVLIEIKIFNIAGQEIENLKVETTNKYNIEHLPSGNYLVKVKDKSNNIYSFKLIKN